MRHVQGNDASEVAWACRADIPMIGQRTVGFSRSKTFDHMINRIKVQIHAYSYPKRRGSACSLGTNTRFHPRRRCMVMSRLSTTVNGHGATESLMSFYVEW